MVIRLQALLIENLEIPIIPQINELAQILAKFRPTASASLNQQKTLCSRFDAERAERKIVRKKRVCTSTCVDTHIDERRRIEEPTGWLS